MGVNDGSERRFDVVISGAGPVGLTTAIDLGRRGVRCLLMERNPTTAPWPKMDRTNARSMEMFRRIGMADGIRALGYPSDNPMDVFLVTRLNEPALQVIKFPSVAEYRARIAACTDGSEPLEPYQLVSQNKVEPYFKAVAEATPNVTVRYGCELVDFSQDDEGVRVTARLHEGGGETFRGRYLVGCDGGVSTVRKGLGVKLEGQGGMAEVTSVIFGSQDLYERIPVGKGRHYTFTDAAGSSLVAQGDRKEFTLHTSLPTDTDSKPVLRDLIGFDCDIEIRHVMTWRYNLLLAERYRVGRVFMAGDAVHLVIPTGGLGMNTGVGDAFDLSWKLAGVVQGWGGPALLDAYEAERRPIGARNVEGAGWAAAGVPIWRALRKPDLDYQSADAAADRAEIAESFRINHGRMHGMVGLERGYSYVGSPIIADEPGNAADWETSRYTPNARPGARIPHMWLEDGRALQDLIGDGYTILDLRGNLNTGPLEAAFAEIGAPLTVLRLDEPRLRSVYGRAAFLLRPDMHIAWRSDEPPDDAAALAARVTGNIDSTAAHGSVH